MVTIAFTIITLAFFASIAAALAISVAEVGTAA